MPNLLCENAPRVGVVLVNWRGWADSLLALETLFGGEYAAFDVVIVDNASGDDSVEHILAWAQGREPVDVPPQLAGRVKARAQQAEISCLVLNESELASPWAAARLTLIRAVRNGGFASGNNLALKYLQQRGGYEYFWLLNNDAFPAPDALTHLLDRATSDPRIGMLGSTLIYADRPEIVQALGGAEYELARGRGHHLGAESSVADLSAVNQADIEQRMAYVVGASMLVSEPFLARVGLMEEGYFLYFEELDWAERAKGLFRLGYAKNSLVFHRAGGSTQAASRRSALAAYYIAFNRLAFTRRFHPEFFMSVWCATFLDAIRYAVRFRWAEARGFFRANIQAARQAAKGERAA